MDVIEANYIRAIAEMNLDTALSSSDIWKCRTSLFKKYANTKEFQEKLKKRREKNLLLFNISSVDDMLKKYEKDYKKYDEKYRTGILGNSLKITLSAWTSDLVLYTLEKEKGIYDPDGEEIVYFIDKKDNFIFKNKWEFLKQMLGKDKSIFRYEASKKMLCGSLDEARDSIRSPDYVTSKEDIEKAIQSKNSLRLRVENLNLEQTFYQSSDNNDNLRDWPCNRVLCVPTLNTKDYENKEIIFLDSEYVGDKTLNFDLLNDTQRECAERIMGKGKAFLETTSMLKQLGIPAIHIWFKHYFKLLYNEERDYLPVALCHPCGIGRLETHIANKLQFEKSYVNTYCDYFKVRHLIWGKLL